MPKLSDSCLLVSLSISSFSGKKTDKRLTGEITQTHRTKSDALRVVKSIVPEASVKGFKQIESEARTFHRNNTVPWTDDGSRMLPSRHHGEYMKTMRDLRYKFEAAADAFCQAWPDTIAQARIDLNGTFNESDYPGERTIGEYFKFRIGCNPVPDVGDIRVDLPAQEMDNIRREIEAQNNEAAEKTRNELYKRLADPLAALVERLSDKDAIFRDSLVNNVLEIADLIPALNVTGDQDLEQARLRIISDLNVRPDDLRDDKFARKNVKEKAQAILDRMSFFEHQEAA